MAPSTHTFRLQRGRRLGMPRDANDSVIELKGRTELA